MTPVTTIQFALVKTGEDESAITVFLPGRDPLHARSDNPRFEAIVQALAVEGESDEQAIIGLFDPGIAAQAKFEPLSERISVRNGRLYIDGDEADSALAQQVLRFVKAGEDFKPLVRFFEKLLTNPLEHSREQLFDWVRAHDEISVSESGDLICFKGVVSDGEGGYTSSNEGWATVNGQPFGTEEEPVRIPNAPGDAVEMPRSDVVHDPNQGCHQGLHVSTFRFAESFVGWRGSRDDGSEVFEVHVNPRDVVSVPNGATKIRCCRYRVIAPASGPHRALVVREEACPLD